jgi:hypothetical protein
VQATLALAETTLNCLHRDVAGLSGLWVSAGEHQAPPDRIEPAVKGLREIQPADGSFNLSRSGSHRDLEGPLGRTSVGVTNSMPM